MIDILVPVLNRPRRVAPLLLNIAQATTVPYRVHFICTEGDAAELEATGASNANSAISIRAGRSEYPAKINYAYRYTDTIYAEHYPWVFVAADDLRFRLGWAEAALATGKRVVGTNDLGNPEARRHKRFSTHTLVARSYIDELGGSLDGPGTVLSEAYDHNWCDRELGALAVHRGEWAYAENSIVEHLHPHWGKGRMDPTYRKGLRSDPDDREIYRQRMKRSGIRYR